jgi:hypothetical protein
MEFGLRAFFDRLEEFLVRSRREPSFLNESMMAIRSLDYLQRSDLRVMLSCCWTRVSQPLLPLEKRHRLSRVVELGGDRGSSAV